MMRSSFRRIWIAVVAVGFFPGTLCAQSAEGKTDKPRLQSAPPVKQSQPTGSIVSAQANLNVPTQTTIQGSKTTTIHESGADGRTVTQTFGDAKRYSLGKDALGNTKVSGNTEIGPGPGDTTASHSDISNSTGCTVRKFASQTYTVCSR